MSAIYRSAEGARVLRQRYDALVERWPVPHEPRVLGTRLGDTFAVVSGPVDAPPVVALQGSGGTTAHWLPDIPVLAGRLRVHAVDAPGEPGRTVEARPPLGSPAYADWLEDVLDALELPRAAVLGTSLGGWWALDFALRRPARVSALVLVNPAGIGRRRVAPLLKFAALSVFGDWGRRRSLAMVAKGSPADPGRREIGEFTLATFEHFKPRLEPIPEFPVERLRELEMPLQAHFGAHDVLLDQRVAAAKLRAARPDADVRLAEDAGHFLPGWAEAAAEFLNGDRK
ncbi:alpha/beta fold hydrolase [Amycolatopsis sp. OK19-0408]|uniref:Alpha/beta fold hydrolase n=1 Tax=Amycolatopsis iheyensis TaxID=2945988 RepID=A0A9X2N6W3_9PSEU|nr:alpha/beta fold hydrolase [Amycolatopsis iheyensis]MCR6483436.1 alpha/beta fold hydrolase [Amycolatopsis iheyensis]